MITLSDYFPESLEIQVNTKCNAACSFCPYSYTEGKRRFELMNWDLYTKIIDECSKHDVKEILPFFSNEPLLNKDLVKYIKQILARNLRTLVR